MPEMMYQQHCGGGQCAGNGGQCGAGQCGACQAEAEAFRTTVVASVVTCPDTALISHGSEIPRKGCHIVTITQATVLSDRVLGLCSKAAQNLRREVLKEEQMIQPQHVLHWEVK